MEWVDRLKMSNYFVFTDEAGAYQRRPSDAHIRSHPFYIRSNVVMSIDDYRQYQIDMQRINGEYEIPFYEEIKWSDLWGKSKDNPRNDLIARMPLNRLKGYYRKIFETATGKQSTCFMFTVTDIVGRTCDLNNDDVYRFHLQDAFQRIEMDMRSESGFATFVMDELNADTINQIKSTCHMLTLRGDFVQYKHLYQGVLTENSLYSPGIQLADYAAGVMNGYLRRKILSPNNYEFANDMFEKFIQPNIRCNFSRIVVGYGVVDIPKKTPFREQLEEIFNYNGVTP